MTNLMKIESLQDGLFRREMETLSAEVGRGLSIVAAALGKYFPAGKLRVGDEKSAQTEVNELHGSLARLTVLRIGYYAGYYASTGGGTKNLQVGDIPGFLAEAVAAKAIADFVAKVEETAGIAEEARAMAEEAERATRQ